MTDKARCLFRVWAAQLAGTEFAPALELLRLFAFGTLAEYKGAARRCFARRRKRLTRPVCLARHCTAAAASGALPPLSPAQLLKLKQLTVASLAEETKVRPACALFHSLCPRTSLSRSPPTR